jgi:hypothetical protein
MPRSEGIGSSGGWLFVLIQDTHYGRLMYKLLKPLDIETAVRKYRNLGGGGVLK